MDGMRGQDVPALLISILAQSYLLLRCHSLWGRRVVTLGMGLLLPVVIGNPESHTSTATHSLNIPTLCQALVSPT
ncbi:hypothetical protein BDV98DRAFT_576475 [Pterulicium gracile]|uniref:Uncharacterized protein n=1 Tax=Pterulicium gracile TaxID=1884261 RepID=A0A5C3Q774_9AGAR|nr:hypothetical protein BDV98DRAFT_576475 [Pterula gracilis]